MSKSDQKSEIKKIIYNHIKGSRLIPTVEKEKRITFQAINDILLIKNIKDRLAESPILDHGTTTAEKLAAFDADQIMAWDLLNELPPSRRLAIFNNHRVLWGTSSKLEDRYLQILFLGLNLNLQQMQNALYADNTFEHIRYTLFNGKEGNTIAIPNNYIAARRAVTARIITENLKNTAVPKTADEALKIFPDLLSAIDPKAVSTPWDDHFKASLLLFAADSKQTRQKALSHARQYLAPKHIIVNFLYAVDKTPPYTSGARWIATLSGDGQKSPFKDELAKSFDDSDIDPEVKKIIERFQDEPKILSKNLYSYLEKTKTINGTTFRHIIDHLPYGAGWGWNGPHVGLLSEEIKKRQNKSYETVKGSFCYQDLQILTLALSKTKCQPDERCFWNNGFFEKVKQSAQDCRNWDGYISEYKVYALQTLSELFDEALN